MPASSAAKGGTKQQRRKAEEGAKEDAKRQKVMAGPSQVQRFDSKSSKPVDIDDRDMLQQLLGPLSVSDFKKVRRTTHRRW